MAAGGESHPTANGTGEAESPRAKTWADWAQVSIALATLGALIVTIVVAWQGQETVKHNSQTTLRQSMDAQLSTAITAIGSADTPEEVAGLLLLTQNTMSRFTLMDQSGEPAADVFSDYTTALQILSGYLSSRSEQFLTGYSDQASSPFGRGYGSPASPGLPLDITYAADQVRDLLSLKMKKDVLSLGLGAPSLDLSNDELSDQSWTDINFRWISAYLVGIDLRGAYLESSKWSKYSDLQHSYLQCTDLQGADFAGANLRYADLEGADVQGANFRGADLDGALIGPVYGTAKWSPQQAGITTLPVAQWNPSACMSNTHFWRNAPAAMSPPSGAHSPKPAASPKPQPSVTATATATPTPTATVTATPVP
jgi:Pentapeptide repeats (8 copies)